MFCTNCGKSINPEAKHCKECGALNPFVPKILPENPTATPQKKSHTLFAVIVTVIITFLITAFFSWGLQLNRDEKVTNVLISMIEMIGRQKQAWTNAEGIITTYQAAFDPQCFRSEECINTAATLITTLRANIDKESVEMENLWQKGTILNDFSEIYENLDDDQKTSINRIFELYFPEEKKELDTTSNSLL